MYGNVMSGRKWEDNKDDKELVSKVVILVGERVIIYGNRFYYVWMIVFSQRVNIERNSLWLREKDREGGPFSRSGPLLVFLMLEGALLTGLGAPSGIIFAFCNCRGKCILALQVHLPWPTIASVCCFGRDWPWGLILQALTSAKARACNLKSFRAEFWLEPASCWWWGQNSALRIKLACTSLRKGQSFVTMLSLDWFPLQPYQIMAVFGETRPENCLRSSRIGPNEDDRRGTWLWGKQLWVLASMKARVFKGMFWWDKPMLSKLVQSKHSNKNWMKNYRMHSKIKTINLNNIII